MRRRAHHLMPSQQSPRLFAAPTPPPGHSPHGYQKIFRAAASRPAISVANISRTNERIFLPAAAASFCSAVAKSPLTRIVKCCSFMVCPLMRTNPCLGTLQRTAIETPRATRKDWWGRRYVGPACPIFRAAADSPHATRHPPCRPAFQAFAGSQVSPSAGSSRAGAFFVRSPEYRS